jgi:plasmid stabilization system protein ParE
VRLRYTSPALADLAAILDYIAAQSPQGAAHVQGRLRKLIELLPSYPQIGGRTEDPTIRRLIATPYPYLVLYEIGEEEIIVHAIRHAAHGPLDYPRSEPPSSD